MPSSQRSSRSSVSLVEARLVRSRLLTAAVVAVHIAASLPAVLLPLPVYVAVSWLVLLTGALGWRLLRRPVTFIRQLPDGRWRLTLADRQLDAELRGWYAHPWVCVALFQAGWRFRRAVTIPFWLVEPEVHRRLRAALRASGEGGR